MKHELLGHEGCKQLCAHMVLHVLCQLHNAGQEESKEDPDHKDGSSQPANCFALVICPIVVTSAN